MREEIAFAHQHGFQAIQLPGPEQGLDTERLGDSLEAVARLLRETGLQAVMEMAVTVDVRGRTANNCTPLDVLQANLPAIMALNINPVHWHLVLPRTTSPAEIAEFEINIRETLAEAVAIAQQHNFQFGLEHNGADIPPFNHPESCRQVIAAVPGGSSKISFWVTKPSWTTYVNGSFPMHMQRFLKLQARLYAGRRGCVIGRPASEDRKNSNHGRRRLLRAPAARPLRDRSNPFARALA